MRRIQPALVIAVGAVLLLDRARPTQATLLVDPTMHARLAAADTVAVGRVVALHPVWEDDAIATRAEVEVLDLARGSLPRRFTLVVHGGVVGGIGMRVLGATTVEVGERAVFLVERRAADPETWRLVDPVAGKLAIERDAAGRDVAIDPFGRTMPLERMLEVLR